MHAVMPNKMRQVAFTLSEVLITLAIIGIVSAMTIPTLINKYQAKVLKNQFNKAYMLLSQSLLYTKNNYGDNLAKYCTYWTGYEYQNKSKCRDMFLEPFKITGICSYKAEPKNYAMNNVGYVDIGAARKPSFRLADGMCFDMLVNAQTLGFTFDINGVDKGPNAFGHDIFVFHVDKTNDALVLPKMTSKMSMEDYDKYMEDQCKDASIYCGSVVSQQGFPCSKDSNQKGNGLGCAWYAFNDISPDNETKGYWESLP